MLTQSEISRLIKWPQLMQEKNYLENGGETLAVVRASQASTSELKLTSQVPEDIGKPNVRVKCHTQP